jgi:hypothetical protein
MAKNISKQSFDELKATALINAEKTGEITPGTVVKSDYVSNGMMLFVGEGVSPCSGNKLYEGVTVDSYGSMRSDHTSVKAPLTRASTKEVEAFFAKAAPVIPVSPLIRAVNNVYSNL